MPGLNDQDLRDQPDFRRSMEFTFGAGRNIMNGYFDLGITCMTVIGVQLPAVWTAADLTVQAVLPDGDPSVDTWTNVYDEVGTEYTITGTAGAIILLPPADLAGLRYLRFRSGTSGTPVAQAARRVCNLIVRPV